MDALSHALVEAMAEVVAPPGPVLEIGSRQVQAEGYGDLRPLFPGREFLGCDAEAGPGVDRVERLESLSFEDGAFGTVLCLSVFEHAWDVAAGARQVHRVTAPGGAALVTTLFEFHIHAYPSDYWRFTPQALERLFEPFESVLVGWQGHAKTPRDVWVLGLKEPRADLADLAERWRRRTLELWNEYPSARDRFRAAVGGTLFGRRGFRRIRTWRELTIRPSVRGG